MKKITDEMLYKYVPIVDDILIKEIEERTNYEYKFSDEFEKKMKKVIFQEKHRNLYKIINSPLKLVASIVIVILVSVFSVTMSVEANRIIFFEKLQAIWEDSFLYKYYVDESSQIHFYEPGYVVEGYEQKKYISNEIVSLYEYYNSDTHQQYNLSQEMVTDGKQVVFDLEYDSVETVNYGILRVDIYRYQNGYVRAYTEYGQYIFSIDADNLSNNQIKKIFENWIK